MPSIAALVARNNVLTVETHDAESEKNRRTINMLMGLLGVVFFGLILATVLVYLRRVKRQRALQNAPPAYSGPQHGALTIQTTDKHGRSSVLVIGKDGQPMLANPEAPPHSPDNVPQIRITFPDEQDEAGRHKSGRVLVVRVGDSNTVGLEPLKEEPLPAYEKDGKSQFYSIDMDQIGGLKEKDRSTFH